MTLDEIKRLAREAKERSGEASAGPWKFYTPSEHTDDYRVARLGTHDRSNWNGGYAFRLTRSHSVDGTQGSLHPREQDAKFVVYARADVPVLADAVLALVEALEACGGSEAAAERLSAVKDTLSPKGRSWIP